MFKLIIIAMTIISCGDPKFFEYPLQNTDAKLGLKKECPILVDTYKATVSNLVEEMCMECHAVGETTSLGFQTLNDRSNAEIFLSLYKSNVQDLLNKLNNITPHQGLDVIEDIDEKNIELFFDVKGLCDAY